MTKPLYLVDTHALFWYEFELPKLSAAAKKVFEEAEKGQAEIILSPIVLAEFYYVLRKEGFDQDYASYIQFISQNPIYRLEPITLDDLEQLPNFVEIPEMHDRLIAIQAKRTGSILVTKDPVIQASPQVKWLW